MVGPEMAKIVTCWYPIKPTTIHTGIERANRERASPEILALAQASRALEKRKGEERIKRHQIADELALERRQANRRKRQSDIRQHADTACAWPADHADQIRSARSNATCLGIPQLLTAWPMLTGSAFAFDLTRSRNAEAVKGPSSGVNGFASTIMFRA